MQKVKLTTLDIGNNFISQIENLSHLKFLEELWVRKGHFFLLWWFDLNLLKMNGNGIPDLLSLEKELGSLSSLTTIYLEGNPCQLNNMSAYRRKVMLALPQLQQIDATWVL